ncbi:NUDIX domain-containing protein [Agrobacterium rhizogenes]|nr:NUDIX domain-containing protein [Rhizobium rhizogenes]NTH38179.1 NUDIX domain-containing protein [Rhizobium rhizogenes]NTJ05368.1 NUDIX domain-containing protein [Rhizobium rhizogenes]
MTAIVLAAFIRDGHVLMVRRAAHKRQFPEHWDLVGGHVEAGETCDSALVRETREEVGLTPIRFEYLEALSDEPTADGDEVTYHIYAVTEWSGGAPCLLGDEHTDLVWVLMEDVIAIRPLAHPVIIGILSRS